MRNSEVREALNCPLWAEELFGIEEEIDTLAVSSLGKIGDKDEVLDALASIEMSVDTYISMLNNLRSACRHIAKEIEEAK